MTTQRAGIVIVGISGTGRACAQALAAAGRVIVVGDPDEPGGAAEILRSHLKSGATRSDEHERRNTPIYRTANRRRYVCRHHWHQSPLWSIVHAASGGGSTGSTVVKPSTLLTPFAALCKRPQSPGGAADTRRTEVERPSVGPSGARGQPGGALW
jgi:hypothetical protein